MLLAASLAKILAFGHSYDTAVGKVYYAFKAMGSLFIRGIIGNGVRIQRLYLEAERTALNPHYLVVFVSYTGKHSDT
jgi:hypothetical protein